MYLEHFGLKQSPFSLTPDLDFYYSFPGHQQALDLLQTAITSGEGFIKITGEVGTGKTLLCRKLLDQLPANRVPAYLPNPLLGPVELYRAIAEEIHAGPLVGGESMHDLQRLILARCLELKELGSRVVVCLDEVQAMSDVSLEALRLLSNLETEKQKLLQIVLFAQPELDVRLEQPHLRQLRQRISFAHHLVPLDRATVRDYIGHRLLVAGCREGGLFSPAACALIARASRGVPRLVNILCHKALMIARNHGARRVEKRHAAEAARDTAEAQTPFAWRDRPGLVWGIGAITLVELVLVVWILVEMG